MPPDQIYRRYANFVRKMVAGRVEDMHEVDDLTHEVFLRLFKRLACPNFILNEHAIPAYLRLTVRAVIADHTARRIRLPMDYIDYADSIGTLPPADRVDSDPDNSAQIPLGEKQEMLFNAMVCLAPVTIEAPDRITILAQVLGVTKEYLRQIFVRLRRTLSLGPHSLSPRYTPRFTEDEYKAFWTALWPLCSDFVIENALPLSRRDYAISVAGFTEYLGTRLRLSSGLLEKIISSEIAFHDFRVNFHKVGAVCVLDTLDVILTERTAGTPLSECAQELIQLGLEFSGRWGIHAAVIGHLAEVRESEIAFNALLQAESCDRRQH